MSNIKHTQIGTHMNTEHSKEAPTTYKKWTHRSADPDP